MDTWDGWRNAHAVRLAHEFEVTRIESDAFAAIARRYAKDATQTCKLVSVSHGRLVRD